MLCSPEKSLYSELCDGLQLQSEEFLQCSPDSFFDSEDCVLTDVNLSEASEDNLLDYKKKFSYNLHSDGDSYPNSPINEMDTDFPATLIVNPSDVKVEPVSPGPAQDSLLHIKTEPGLPVKQEEADHPPQLRPFTTPASSASPVSLLKQPTIVITSRPSTRLLVPKLPTSSSLKLEETGGRWQSSKAATKIVVGSQQSVKSSSRRAIDSHLISTNTAADGGELFLTEEEKRTLISEGYSIPKKLPLSKAEERSLKKIRRKIKNKISAQESRRKKKEYLDLLERKYEAIQDERNIWMRKCEELECQNKELQKQLSELKSQIIDFDDVVASPCTAVEQERNIMEIPDPFEIDVD